MLLRELDIFIAEKLLGHQVMKVQPLGENGPIYYKLYFGGDQEPLPVYSIILLLFSRDIWWLKVFLSLILRQQIIINSKF